MSRPGVEVTSSASAPAAGVPTDTSVAFILGEAERGPVDKPTRITSMAQFDEVYGARLPGTYGYDGVDTYQRVGGAVCYYMRLTEGAVVAEVDAATIAVGSTATAANPGVWANTLDLEVTATPGLFTQSEREGEPEPERSEFLTYPEPQATGTFMGTVKLGGKLVAASQPLDTAGELADWLATTGYMTLSGHQADGAVTAETVTLAGGSDGLVP